MNTRPAAAFGAAFLATTAAALFAPLLLLCLGTALGLFLLFGRKELRGLAVALSLGCLTAMLASGLFFVRLEESRTLVGGSWEASGTVFYDGGRQLSLLRFPDGKERLAELFPPIPELNAGDPVGGSFLVTQTRADGGSAWLNHGVLLTCAPGRLDDRPKAAPVPFAIQTMLLRERACAGLRELYPSSATDVTVAVLFSVKSFLSPQLRADFNKSGMGHLLSVSGLHLSILVWSLVGLVKRLGGGRRLQAAVGTLAALTVFFAAGMGPAVFRATLMTLLTLAGTLISRKSDGLTSLAVAAVLLTAVCPPALANLSFLLSFSSALGILTLAPRLSAYGERLCVSRFGSCGKGTRGVFSALSVSLAAQLACAPFLAFAFGAVPALGMGVNLAAIPLVYPVLVCGFAACLALAAGAAGLALPLLLAADLFSGLLAVLARFTAKLPFAALPTLFPADLLPLLFFALAVLAALFPITVRRRRAAMGVCGCAAVVTLLFGLYAGSRSVVVASVSPSGSLLVADRTGAALLADTRSADSWADGLLLSRLGWEGPALLALPYPHGGASAQRKLAARWELAADRVVTREQLASGPVELLPGVWAVSPQPYLTEITVGDTKIMKFYAVYDTIEKLELPAGDVLLSDLRGNLFSAGGRRVVYRRGNGESLARIAG